MSSIQQNKPSIGGHWYIIFAALLWGTSGTAQAFSPAGFDPNVIGAMRLVIGGSALMFLAIKRKDMGRLKDWSFFPLLAAALLTASYQICFFTAVAKTGVAVGTIVGVGSAPIAGGLLGRIFRGEHLSKRWGIATILAICGCILLSLTDGDVSVDTVGIIFALGAGVSYSSYTLVIKGMLEKLPPNAIMAAVVCLAGVILSPMLFNIDQQWLWQPRSIIVILHLGLITMALSYWFFSRGLMTVPVSSATTLSLAEPATAAVLGIVVLGEQMTSQSLSGIALIFAGLVVLMAKRKKKSTYPLSEV